MEIKVLNEKAVKIMTDFIKNWSLPKENHNIDYKKQLNISDSYNETENLLINLWKDIISFANSEGGIIFLWFEENKSTWKIQEIWLSEDNLEVLGKIDLNNVEQQLQKICKWSTSLDLKLQNIWTKKFYYFIIEKSSNTLIPINDKKEYKLNKWEIWYRVSWKNEKANSWTSEFNRFIQVKANEKSKEFMQIWSNLLPEMVDINPKEVLILNPNENKVYWFNNKDYELAGVDIEVSSDEWNIFNIILETIKSWDIWKITTDEWKPIYKIVWELKEKWQNEHIQLTTLTNEVQKLTQYNISQTHIKQLCHYLNWVSTEKFNVIIKNDSDEKNINKIHNDFIWVEVFDAWTANKKIVFSKNAIIELSKIIENKNLHIEIFAKNLNIK